MFKFFNFGKLQLISIIFNFIFLSIILLVCLIIFKINFISEEIVFNKEELKTISSGYNLLNFIVLFFFKILFLIHIFYSIQSIFFDYLNPGINMSFDVEGILKVFVFFNKYVKEIWDFCINAKNIIFYQFFLIKPLLKFLNSYLYRREVLRRLFIFENLPVLLVIFLMMIIFSYVGY